MSIEERIVSDEYGNTTGTELIGTIKQKDIYTFYAVNPSKEDVQEITLVLPIGGSLSGLYRFPRVGERVLVEMGTSRKYLLGYIPSPNEGKDEFAPVENNTTVEEEQAKLLETGGRGMVLRYRQTGKKQDKADADKKYSEIGFYHEATQWKPGKDAKRDYADIPSAGEDEGFPKIDRINIRSTGDIYESAVNHHQVRAKRMEILVNKNGQDFSKMKVNEDDDYLRSGDLHITAGNRIIINADEEIQLRVGRSCIVISDEKIEIKSKKTHKASSGNSWDTTIELDPNSGVSMFGQHLEFSSAYGFEIKETYGGCIGSTSGMLKVSGRDVKLESMNTVLFFVKGGLALTDFITNCSSIGYAQHDKDESKAIPYVNSVCGFLSDGIDSGWGGYQDWGDDVTWIDLLKTAQDLLLKINSLIFTILSTSCDSPEERDGICLAGIISEFFLILAAYVPLCVCGGLTGMTNNSEINLTPSSDIIEEANFIDTSAATGTAKAVAPLLGAISAGKKAPNVVNLGMSITGTLISLIEGILDEALGNEETAAELGEL